MTHLALVVEHVAAHARASSEQRSSSSPTVSAAIAAGGHSVCRVRFCVKCRFAIGIGVQAAVRASTR
jgi:hypothetical protein